LFDALFEGFHGHGMVVRPAEELALLLLAA